jgi:putative endonuclease
MAEHNDLGELGEEMAADYLRRNGYEILERNWKFAKAEIDIIAQRDNIVAAIEVKTRSGNHFGLPQDFVDKKKIGLLILAINQYVEMHDVTHEVRFDIIAIQRTESDFIVEHIEDAFFHF